MLYIFKAIALSAFFLGLAGTAAAQAPANCPALLDHCFKRLQDEALAKGDWFAGNEFSAADIQLSFPLEAAAARAGLDASRPRLMDFLARIHARPAYRRALEQAGAYDMIG